MKTCTNCKQQFTPKNEWQKYCSNSCRYKSFNTKKNNTENANTNDMTNDMTNDSVTHVVDRLLSEREAVYEAKLRATQIEHEKKILELKLIDMEKRLNAIERAHDDLEKENSKGGISMPDIINAAAMYLATQNQQSNTKGNDSK